jgi:hypothetical protein
MGSTRNQNRAITTTGGWSPHQRPIRAASKPSFQRATTASGHGSLDLTVATMGARRMPGKLQQQCGGSLVQEVCVVDRDGAVAPPAARRR